MRLLRGLLLIAIGAAAVLVAGRLAPDLLPLGGSPEIERTAQKPGDPPLVWIGGTLAAIGQSELTLAEGEGPKIVLQRFSGDSTSFYRPDGDEWRQMDAAEIKSVDDGELACVEALVDNDSFLALRVFLERDCAPE